MTNLHAGSPVHVLDVSQALFRGTAERHHLGERIFRLIELGCHGLFDEALAKTVELDDGRLETVKTLADIGKHD